MMMGVFKPKNDVFRQGCRLRFDVSKGSIGVQIKVFGKMPSQGVLVFMYHQNSQKQNQYFEHIKSKKSRPNDRGDPGPLPTATASNLFNSPV